MTGKTPSAATISRLLAAAGFTRAVVKLRGGTAGFDVHAYYSTRAVRVEHYSNTMGMSGGLNEVKLDAYARTIAEAGYDVARPNPQWLIVTAKTEAS